MNGDVDDAWFSLYSHPRSRIENYTAGDLTGGNMALSSTAHQEVDRESAKTAANGPDRRAGGIGRFSLQTAFWSDLARAAIGTVLGQ